MSAIFARSARCGGMPVGGHIACAVLIAFGVEAAQAQPAQPDKSAYNLFNPTPTELMRPLSADRPDATESPFTVDAGHLQVELSFFSYTEDREDGDVLESWSVFDTNVKVGVLNNVDVQFVFAAFTEETARSGSGPTERIEGFSDLEIRTKVNLWGNDPVAGEQTAFAVMPFVKVPTGTSLSNNRVEGGVIASWGWDFAENMGLGLQGKVDFVYDEDDDGYDTEFAHTAVLGFDVAGPVGAYVEYLGIVSSDGDQQYQAYFSTGMTYEVLANMLLDVGVLVGLNSAADDVTAFTGMTMRF